ncbi:putative geranylgeranyl diphosphate synthase [Delitschia confertaspora ATCC 74209]|uniref:Geranylgeranyl diphosphate synthase n=1 Tax=Delitschia confertaspora ATCC 74209 TaxID=1513339 RepID=A0A9P4JUW3_9PLEO|nr:putative geranylgeranyl diphosphate synthase [Delitschia confertaspora ATCC 74209]
MEFRYSEIVEPGVYQTHGLGHDIPLRIHRDPDSEIRGALRAQRDWSKLVGPVFGYQGGLGDQFSFIRVTVPECLPERLEVISYANEFAFLYDDEMERLDLKTLKEGKEEMLGVFEKDALSHTIDVNTRPEKKLQAQILMEMMAIDKERAVTSMKAWATFVQLASKTRTTPFLTLEEYLPSRIIDAGELIWFGTLTFGMGLTIPDGELDTCMKLARPGYAAISLTNDLYSWEKERRDAEGDGLDYVFNAVWVIMQERSISEKEAMEVCRDEIKKYIAEYCRIVEDASNDSSLSRDTRAYLEAVRWSHIGNLVWSIYCPRYKI